MLQNYFYVGLMTWGGKQYPGTHELFITPNTFNEVQAVLAGHNRPKYSKREVALRGLMNCAYDGCMLTGDVRKKRSTSTTDAPAIAGNVTFLASGRKISSIDSESP